MPVRLVDRHARLAWNGVVEFAWRHCTRERRPPSSLVRPQLFPALRWQAQEPDQWAQCPDCQSQPPAQRSRQSGQRLHPVLQEPGQKSQAKANEQQPDQPQTLAAWPQHAGRQHRRRAIRKPAERTKAQEPKPPTWTKPQELEPAERTRGQQLGPAERTKGQERDDQPPAWGTDPQHPSWQSSHQKAQQPAAPLTAQQPAAPPTAQQPAAPAREPAPQALQAQKRAAQTQAAQTQAAQTQAAQTWAVQTQAAQTWAVQTQAAQTWAVQTQTPTPTPARERCRRCWPQDRRQWLIRLRDGSTLTVPRPSAAGPASSRGGPPAHGRGPPRTPPAPAPAPRDGAGTRPSTPRYVRPSRLTRPAQEGRNLVRPKRNMVVARAASPR
jgi:hypothetical protein